MGHGGLLSLGQEVCVSAGETVSPPQSVHVYLPP